MTLSENCLLMKPIIHCLPGEVDVVRQVVVQVGECDFVLCPDRLSDDDLVDVIELIPVFVPMGESERDQLQYKAYSISLWMLFI